MRNKTVVVTGATGTIGKVLCKRLQERGYHVVVFSRDPEKAGRLVPDMARYVRWEPAPTGLWESELDGVHAVIHLASAPAFGKRWTHEYKRTLYQSCAIGTRGIADAIIAAAHKPEVFISASSIGYYGYNFPSDYAATQLDENAPAGDDLIAYINKEWEKEAMQAAELANVRTVLLRTGFLLAPQSGGLPYIVASTKRYMGGPILPGTQYQSWIHIDDAVGMILMALEDAQVHGPVNVVAPQSTTNAQLMKALRTVMGRTLGLPTFRVTLRLFMGEAANILTKGHNVVPRRMQERGYQFQYPTIEGALRNLLVQDEASSYDNAERRLHSDSSSSTPMRSR